MWTETGLASKTHVWLLAYAPSTRSQSLSGRSFAIRIPRSLHLPASLSSPPISVLSPPSYQRPPKLPPPALPSPPRPSPDVSTRRPSTTPTPGTTTQLGTYAPRPSRECPLPVLVCVNFACPALGSSRCARRLVHAHIAIAINPGCAAVYELPQDVTRLQRPLPTRSYTVIRSAHAPDKAAQDPHSRPIVLLPCQPAAVLAHSSSAPLASPVRVSSARSLSLSPHRTTCRKLPLRYQSPPPV